MEPFRGGHLLGAVHSIGVQHTVAFLVSFCRSTIVISEVQVSQVAATVSHGLPGVKTIQKHMFPLMRAVLCLRLELVGRESLMYKFPMLSML